MSDNNTGGKCTNLLTYSLAYNTDYVQTNTWSQSDDNNKCLSVLPWLHEIT